MAFTFEQVTFVITLYFWVIMSFYYVVVHHDQILGGAGIFPTEGLPKGICELVKMYLSKNVRGLGLGKMMIEKCMETAVELGYTKMYLETLPELKNAVQKLRGEILTHSKTEKDA